MGCCPLPLHEEEYNYVPKLSILTGPRARRVLFCRPRLQDSCRSKPNAVRELSRTTPSCPILRVKTAGRGRSAGHTPERGLPTKKAELPHGHDSLGFCVAALRCVAAWRESRQDPNPKSGSRQKFPISPPLLPGISSSESKSLALAEFLEQRSPRRRLSPIGRPVPKTESSSGHITIISPT